MIKIETISVLKGLPWGITCTDVHSQTLWFTSAWNEPMRKIDLDKFVEAVFASSNKMEFFAKYNDVAYLTDLPIMEDECTFENLVELAHWLNDNLWVDPVEQDYGF